jgi:hypothetical protein
MLAGVLTLKQQEWRAAHPGHQNSVTTKKGKTAMHKQIGDCAPTHAQGAGIFEMIVEKPSGKVKGVYVRSSTHNPFLEADLINAFSQWHFKPHTESSVIIVVAFTADNDAVFYPVGSTIHATNRGLPIPFREPVKPEELWQWFPELYGAAVIDETPEVLRQSS